MSPCKCEYAEEVNAIQSGARIRKLVKKCAECEERDRKALEERRKKDIEGLREQIKLLEVDIQSVKTLGYEDVVAKKQEVIEAIQRRISYLECA